MDTTYRQTTAPIGVEPVSAWRTPRFQKFAAIVVGSALLASLVAVFNLKADIDILTKQVVPDIQSRIAMLQFNK